MRQARIKVDAQKSAAVYHVITRTVNGERLLDDVAKEVLRKQIWQIADFCGVQIVTYAILSNHFHVLLRVPRQTALTDRELLRRYEVLYPKPTRYQTAQLNVIKGQLKNDELDAEAWRWKQLALMGDVSQFMKLVKQRFSIWYNRSHQRFGTLWAERFKSVLVEGSSGVMMTMAAYIDLNAVRAGLVTDPKDYRFCGYGEAVGSNAAARRGLCHLILGSKTHWKSAQASYRQTLFGKGSAPKQRGARLDPADFEKVLKSKGQLAPHDVLRSRVRYFTEGVVLGSREFVQGYLTASRRANHRGRSRVPRSLPEVTGWEDLTTLRGLRGSGFG